MNLHLCIWTKFGSFPQHNNPHPTHLSSPSKAAGEPAAHKGGKMQVSHHHCLVPGRNISVWTLQRLVLLLSGLCPWIGRLYRGSWTLQIFYGHFFFSPKSDSSGPLRQTKPSGDSRHPSPRAPILTQPDPHSQFVVEVDAHFRSGLTTRTLNI